MSDQWRCMVHMRGETLLEVHDMKRAGVYTSGNKNKYYRCCEYHKTVISKSSALCTVRFEALTRRPVAYGHRHTYIYIKVPRFWHRSYSIIRVQMWHFRTEHEDHLSTWLNLLNNTMHDPAWWEAPLSKTKVPPAQNHLSLEELTIINWEWKLISRWWIVGETKLCIPSIRADKWF